MKIPAATLLACLALSGCSTVERHTYYSPQLAGATTPESPACGWTNFGGKPDRLSLEELGIELSAYQAYQPYLWGPWFASIVPIFPITWVIQLFKDGNVLVRVETTEGASMALTPNSFALEPEPGGTPIAPTSFRQLGPTVYDVEFPVRARRASRFTLLLMGLGPEGGTVAVPFSKTARWSWTQWSPNC